jgi:hypothetical protein
MVKVFRFSQWWNWGFLFFWKVMLSLGASWCFKGMCHHHPSKCEEPLTQQCSIISQKSKIPYIQCLRFIPTSTNHTTASHTVVYSILFFWDRKVYVIIHPTWLSHTYTKKKLQYKSQYCHQHSRRDNVHGNLVENSEWDNIHNIPTWYYQN